MNNSRTFRNFLFLILIGTLLVACYRPSPGTQPWQVSSRISDPPASLENPTSAPLLPPTPAPDQPSLSPTPDAPHDLPQLRSKPITYQVRSGDTLGVIARRHAIDLGTLIAANPSINPNLLYAGQVLTIPAPQLSSSGSDLKIIPDSELVNGPYASMFDARTFIKETSGVLRSYHEEVDEVTYSGSEILRRVAAEYSVNPRLLLALLEYQSGMVTKNEIKQKYKDYPLGFEDPYRKGLYLQLAWAANELNRGYYLWRVNGIAYLTLADHSLLGLPATLNAGTVGVQNLFARLYGAKKWQQAVSAGGLLAVYQNLFGDPFSLGFDPILPDGLTQPSLQLPFADGDVWSFTSGPHAGWDDGSAWAALDFGPPGDAFGCYLSHDWVVAAADGKIVRSNNGAVVQDLDGDGYEGTGWTLLYMHIAAQDRVPVGTVLKAGDRIGHPSCEGGISNGTHLHFARRYNGEWISADQALPFVLDGWVSKGAGKEYDGTMTRNKKTVEAFDGRLPQNQIQR